LELYKWEDDGLIKVADDVCAECSGYVMQLNATAGVGTADLPVGWRQPCLKCLEDEADANDVKSPSDWVTVAGMMALSLLEQHRMPFESAVSYDESQLPPSPKPGVSAVCHSCIVNWAVEDSSIDVANDREKLAHCHACLKETADVDRQAADTAQSVVFGLASRLVGKFITAPVVRKLKREMAASRARSSDSSRSKQAGKGGALGAPAASKPAGKFHSSSSSSRRLTCSIDGCQSVH
jgi:hypothetical protein